MAPPGPGPGGQAEKMGRDADLEKQLAHHDDRAKQCKVKMTHHEDCARDLPDQIQDLHRNIAQDAQQL